MSSPMNIPLAKSIGTMYMPMNDPHYNAERLMHKFHNCKMASNMPWFPGTQIPPHAKDEYPVVMCHNMDDDEYEVCYWDGRHFLQKADDMPFMTHRWSYLPT